MSRRMFIDQSAMNRNEIKIHPTDNNTYIQSWLKSEVCKMRKETTEMRKKT